MWGLNVRPNAGILVPRALSFLLAGGAFGVAPPAKRNERALGTRMELNVIDIYVSHQLINGRKCLLSFDGAFYRKGEMTATCRHSKINQPKDTFLSCFLQDQQDGSASQLVPGIIDVAGICYWLVRFLSHPHFHCNVIAIKCMNVLLFTQKWHDDRQW